MRIAAGCLHWCKTLTNTRSEFLMFKAAAERALWAQPLKAIRESRPQEFCLNMLILRCGVPPPIQ
jgi:hypothetical protein